MTMQRIAVMTSGGDAPGMNAAIRAVVRTATAQNIEVYGIRQAYSGLLSGDLERMGMLSFDSWRFGRLVVDTGLHALGWGRRQAIDYLASNSPQAPNNIENEVDRYIGFAGQALAYKIGQREIVRLRDQARREMGPRFDIKGFHDTVLGCGPVPLAILGEVVHAWMEG